MASRQKRGYSDLGLYLPPRDLKRSKGDNRTSLQALTLHQNNDAETLTGTIASSSPTLIDSSSSRASSQTSADSNSEESIPSLLESSDDDDDSPSESDDISSSDSSDPSSSSLELNRPTIPIQPDHPNYANRDTDSSSSSSSNLSSSSSDSADSGPSSSESDSHSDSSDTHSSPSSDSPSSSSSLTRSPVLLTSRNLSTLQSRLTSFLPTMQAANQRLEEERMAGRLADRDIENVGEDPDRYIEMDLGLGVLEERGKENLPIAAKAEDKDEDEESSQGEERDVLGRLMGKRREKPGIQIV